MSINRRKLLAQAAAAGAATLASPTKLFADNRPPLLLIAHHGATKFRPENTLDSCAEALKHGANALEIDLCFSQDRQPFLWHDWNSDAADALARQIGLQPYTAYRPSVPGFGSPWRRPVNELMLADITAHFSYAPLHRDFGRGYAPPLRREQAPIPTLTDFFYWTKNRRALKAVFIDIKMPDSDVGRAPAMLDAIYKAMPWRDKNPPFDIVFMVPEERVLDCLMAHDRRRNYKSVFSWDVELPPPLVINPQRFSAIDHAVEKCLSVASVGRPTAASLFPWCTYKQVIDYDIRRWKEVNSNPNNRRIESMIAWTINDYDELEYLARAGVSGIITDDITALRCAATAASRRI